MAVRAKAEVLDGLTSILGATEEKGVGPGGRAERKLVQGQHLTAGLLDPGSGGGSEAEGRDRELGDGQDAVVIGNGADDDDSLALVGFGGVLDDAGERDGRAVDPGHEQAAQHDFVEVGISAAWGILYQHRREEQAHSGCRKHTGKEAIQLHQNLQIDVLALGRRAVGVPHMMAVQVDTCDSRGLA